MSFEEEQIAGKPGNLRQVDGAGKVSICAALRLREEYAVNTTTGKAAGRDQTGGTRLTTEDTSSGQLVMGRSETGEERPVVELVHLRWRCPGWPQRVGAGQGQAFEQLGGMLLIPRILILKMERRE